MSIKGNTAIYSKVIINALFIIASLICIIPFLLVVSISLSNETDIALQGFKLVPASIDLLAYKYILSNPNQILQSYYVTITTTLVGTAISVLFMAMAAYPLTRSSFKYRRFISFYYLFTMLFSGGLVPSYILTTKYLNMDDTWWVLWVPGLISAWYIFMLRTFIQGLPESIFESAKLDGANEFKIFLTFVLPLSKPALATIAFYGVLGRWNDWFTSLLYIKNQQLLTLQYLLYRIMSNVEFLSGQMQMGKAWFLMNVKLPGETARMAMCVLAAGPILIAFPFFQEFFIKGMTIGSVKG